MPARIARVGLVGGLGAIAESHNLAKQDGTVISSNSDQCLPLSAPRASRHDLPGKKQVPTPSSQLAAAQPISGFAEGLEEGWLEDAEQSAGGFFAGVKMQELVEVMF